MRVELLLTAANISQEECLRTLNHLFIDIKRLTYEQGYEEIVGGYCELKVATLDSGMPTAKLVAAKRLRLGVRATEPKRLAFVGITHSDSDSRLRSDAHLDSDWLANSRSGRDSSTHTFFPYWGFTLATTTNRQC